MCHMISCLVGSDARVYAKDGVHSHTEIAQALGLREDRCLKYEFRLKTKTLFQDFSMDSAPFEAKKSHDDAAQAFFDKCASTPEKLVAFVRRGNFGQNTLGSLLTESAHGAYCRAKKFHDDAYDKTMASANKAYDKAEASAYRVCDKARASAERRYGRVYRGVWPSTEKVHDRAITSAEKVCRKALASANKVCYKAVESAGKVCDKAETSADKAYEKAMISTWLKLFSNPDNRIDIWKK